MTRSLLTGTGIVAIGVLVALVSVVTLSVVQPMKFVFAIAGLVLLIPAFVVQDPRAYGLFWLALFIPIEIPLHTTKWLADPWVLFQQYGLPASGTLGVDLYVADLVLIAMLIPWLGQLCRRHQRLYFPGVGYIFVLYLTWALLISLMNAPSLYLAIFGWVREILYFVFFLYVVNNVVTPAQFRAVVLALVVGLVIESIAVIAFFQLGIGTESGLFQQMMGGGNVVQSGSLPVAESGSWSRVKRSAGTFTHPAETAYYLGYILPIVLAYVAVARRRLHRMLVGAIFAGGSLALLLTFSRSGMVALIGSIGAFLPLGRWSRLISRQAFARCVLIAVMAAVPGTPLLIYFLETRPVATTVRVELIRRAVATYWEHPILGAGLNNSSAATPGSHEYVATKRSRSLELVATVVHNHYLVVLIEVGAIGFVLFFGFFVAVATTAVRSMRAAARELSPLLAGIVCALLGVAIHNFGDPFGGHMSMAMLWLNVALVLSICHRVQADLVPAHALEPSLGVPPVTRLVSRQVS